MSMQKEFVGGISVPFELAKVNLSPTMKSYIRNVIAYLWVSARENKFKTALVVITLYLTRKTFNVYLYLKPFLKMFGYTNPFGWGADEPDELKM